jgi:hypothetical protein
VITNPTKSRRSLERLVRPRCFVSPRGYAKPFDVYRSRFGFVWWFWLPRLHAQQPDEQNPRVIRVIWLCFAVGLEIWGRESRSAWPNSALNDSPSQYPNSNPPA